MNVIFSSLFGYKQDDLLNRSINILFNSDDYKVLQECLNNAAYPQNVPLTQKFELNGFCKDKSIIPLEITIFKSDVNQNHMFTLIMRDISEFKQNVDKLKYLAYYDQLTKIPNRTLFCDRAETAIRLAKRGNEKLAIIYIDIDEFKTINDTMGHEIGDKILKELANRFQKCVRDSDTVSRVGGDEFTILMLKINSLEDISIVAKRILESNLVPFKINEQEIMPKTSLGISIFPKDGDNIQKLLKNADIAMYCAKNKGPNKFVVYKKGLKKND